MSATVDVWLVDTRDPYDETLLTPADRARRDALRDARDRRRFAAAHAALQRIVAGRLGGAAVCWVRGPNGKPGLHGDPLRVSLSHAGEYALIAVAADRPVGADLQDLVPGLDWAALARRFFPPAEAGRVEAAGAGEFARLWARKEAVVKAAGDRLTRGLGLPVAGDPAPVVEHAGVAYAVTDLPAPDGFRAAVALAGPEPFVIRTMS
ncbi:4'-phosphopantetheinyl transferase family protein [Dactylosporangium sp. CA-139066]|uniref:4'-phosphopantetheinyl transferase family protein n=1 Tax=Dactylosporangium sp. CA-139066 TaxID=3239930 RepID=UPI003D8CD98E